MPTFPNDRVSAGHQQSAALFTNMTLTARATIADALTGRTIPGAQLDLGPDGLWPLFTSPSTVLYYRNANGQTVSMVPAVGAASPVTVTGAKGSNAALGSLVAALIAVGIPIVDGTSA